MRHIIVASFMLLLVGCRSNMQTYKTYKIEDLSSKQTIVLKKGNSQKNVHAITIFGEGNINGQASISLLLPKFCPN